MAVDPIQSLGKGTVATSSVEQAVQVWVERIRDCDMPVFGRTVQEVRLVTEDENASASRLARVILQDMALTTKVLKLANSVVFNPGRQNVSTVSRAIVVLGFDLVGQIVLSIHLIDALLSGGRRDRVVTEMARCFHAAVQARTAAVVKGCSNAEEVFIAALLGQVGAMAFWCFGGKQAEVLDAELRGRPEEKPEAIQLEILGFRLRNLTAALAREWQLGGLVESVAEPRANPGDEEQAITQGYRLAAAVENGWDTPSARAALAQYAEFTGRTLKEITGELALNAAEAARVATQFGAEEAARLIPVPPAGGLVDIDAEIARMIDPEPDPLLQLKILRDLSMLLGGQPTLNDVLQLVLEGIYRGLGMTRAVFALQSADRTKLIGKVGLGRDAEYFTEHFIFPLDGRPGEIVNTVVSRASSFWLRGEAPEGMKIDRLESITGRNDGMIAPILASGRVIGIFYADRKRSAPPDEEIWMGFLHFVQQASLSFEHVAARNTIKSRSA
jgi:HD-like signal output (HDOD) protein